MPLSASRQKQASHELRRLHEEGFSEHAAGAREADLVQLSEWQTAQPTIQAHTKLGRYIDVGPIEVFRPGEVNGNLPHELVQVL
jgi:hypothetical protein